MGFIVTAGVNGRKPHSHRQRFTAFHPSSTTLPAQPNNLPAVWAAQTRPVRGALVGLLLPAFLAVACRESPRSPGSVGQLQVRWNGPRGGSISGTATAGWCPIRRALEIRTVQGDTGVALALYPEKALEAGVYRVVEPAKAESVPPAAGVAVRWLAQSAVQGFQGDSGRVQLERSGPSQFSGSVSARARSVVDTQRIMLSGTFRDLTVVPDTLGCVPPDTSEEDAQGDDNDLD